jgi:cytoskeletal protein CcmA (bactofilin family)
VCRKKKGASLITVVVVFAILLTVGTATLALTATDYSVRVGESKRVQNLYSAESGLDVTNEVVDKLLQRAIKKGNDAVDALMVSIEAVIDEERSRLKDDSKATGLTYVNSSGNIDEEKIKLAQNDTFKTIFKNYVTESKVEFNNKSRIVYAIEKSIYFNDSNQEVAVDFNVQNKPTISIAASNVNFNVDNLALQVQSSFKTSVTGTSSISNLPFERTVQVNFNIKVPNYNDNYYVQTEKLSMPVIPVYQRAIAVDGDLTINGNVEIYGDIFVKGKDSSISDKVYDKYTSGIKIQGKNGPTKFTGTIVTANSFNVKDTNSVIINKYPDDINGEKSGKLFANNVYVGKSTPSDVSTTSSSLTVNGAVYTDNDLALNAPKSSITIDEYYGISDKTDLSSPIKRLDNKEERLSSSILINSSDIGAVGGSSINIRNKAYIMGTAYIQTTPKPYQTGESVAVKGNYIAYANELNSQAAINEGLNSSNVYFGYYNPLQMVEAYNNKDGARTEMLLEDKNKYFSLYAGAGNLSTLKTGGISLPENTVSVANYISNGQVYPRRYTSDTDGVINDLKKEYAKQVFLMGHATSVNFMDKYEKANVEKYVYNNQVDFDEVPTTFNQVIDGDRVIINHDKNKKVVISGIGSTVAGDIQVDATSTGKVKGVIVTAGDVEIAGQVDFKGTIITAGDLTTAGDVRKKTITYDSNYVIKVIGYNYDKFKTLFNLSDPISTQTIEVSAKVGKASVGSSVVTNQLITRRSWKILK